MMTDKLFNIPLTQENMILIFLLICCAGILVIAVFVLFNASSLTAHGVPTCHEIAPRPPKKKRKKKI